MEKNLNRKRNLWKQTESCFGYIIFAFYAYRIFNGIFIQRKEKLKIKEEEKKKTIFPFSGCKPFWCLSKLLLATEKKNTHTLTHTYTYRLHVHIYTNSLKPHIHSHTHTFAYMLTLASRLSSELHWHTSFVFFIHFNFVDMH